MTGNTEQKSPDSKSIWVSIAGLLWLAPPIFMIWGVVRLGGQAIDYLKKGYWQQDSFFEFVRPLSEWLNSPTSWYGLYEIVYKFLDFFSTGVGLIVFGMLSIRVVDLIVSDTKKSLETKKKHTASSSRNDKSA